MRIALLGGTGDIGQGLALRWALDTDHELLVGSRDPERARGKADEYETELEGRGVGADIKGFENAMAADRADVVVLAVPAYHLVDTVEAVAVLVADAVPDEVPLVGAFHNLPAGGLADLDHGFEWDTLVFGDDEDAKDTVTRLAEGIEGLRALDAGGIENAAEVEAVTPLLINVAANNEGLHDLGVRFG